MFFGWLHPNLTTKRLIDYFSQFSKIEKGIIMTDKIIGKNFGFIVFKEKEIIDKINSFLTHFLYDKWIEWKTAQLKSQNCKIKMKILRIQMLIIK